MRGSVVESREGGWLHIEWAVEEREGRLERGRDEEE